MGRETNHSNLINRQLHYAVKEIVSVDANALRKYRVYLVQLETDDLQMPL